MAGILDGIKVLDLSRGMPGPMTGMLLADEGADVIRIEPPDGDSFEHLPAYAVWNRGKRHVTLDLKDSAQRDDFLELAKGADVVLESFAPGITRDLGVDYATLAKANPGLVYCSITGYGRNNKHSSRPGIDGLVAARANMQWDQRGYFGTRNDHVMNRTGDGDEFPVPPGSEQTGCREGPIFLAMHWPSIGACLLASSGINAALYVAQRTGQGQWVETSLLQGAMMMGCQGWQRVGRPEFPGYALWYFDRRAPKGIFQCGDGLWVHQWAPIEHQFIRKLAGVETEEDASEPPSIGLTSRASDTRSYFDDVRTQVLKFPETAEAFKMLPRDRWIELFAEAGKAAQPILSAEQGLMDEALEREQAIVEVEDPHYGLVRQVGHLCHFEKVSKPPINPRQALSEDEKANLAALWQKKDSRKETPLTTAPLEGILVLDFGLAVAGPYGPQILADLGAEVIKVSSMDSTLSDAIYVGISRGKKSLAVNLKDPRGLEVAHHLIKKADVVHHNMRTGVAERLGIDYATCREMNPGIIFCHNLGFEVDGPRTPLPGNDQTGSALSGTNFEAGGTYHGTPPIWAPTAIGDLGAGVSSAIAVLQALRHRDKTGEGQFINASILNTAMLYNSYTFAFPDGTGPERARLDAQQYGFSALYRLYETAEGWICICARSEAHWQKLCTALEHADLATDPRFVDPVARAENDSDLSQVLDETFKAGTSQAWFQLLDQSGVPCEIASDSFSRELLDDPEMRSRGWTVSNPHLDLEHVEQVGTLIEFSGSRTRDQGGPPVTGQHSAAILKELGYTTEQIDALVKDGVILSRPC